MFYIRPTNLLILFLLLLPLNSLCRESIIDLGAINHDFVLEAKRIQIPGYPYTFNPSIVRWNDSFLMTFRIHDGEKQSIKPIGLIWLDKNFNIISKPYVLEIRNQKKNTFFVQIGRAHV